MNCPVATIKKAIRKVQLPSQLPPKPKGHRFLGILPGRRDWVRTFGDVLKDAGDVAYCKYVGMPACIVGHPDQIADVLVVNAQSYTKSNMLRMLLGDGLATSEGELWRRQRNLLLPVFSRERLPEYGPIITRHIDRMMSSWKDEGVHDIYRDMMRLTLDVAAEAFLGTQLNGRQDTLLKNLGIVLDEFIVQADQCFLVPRLGADAQQPRHPSRREDHPRHCRRHHSRAPGRDCERRRGQQRPAQRAAGSAALWCSHQRRTDSR